LNAVDGFTHLRASALNILADHPRIVRIAVAAHDGSLFAAQIIRTLIVIPVGTSGIWIVLVAWLVGVVVLGHFI
jgi:hypothetical protein